MILESVARTDVGLRRKINEDALLSRPDLGLWAVADGMGGHDAGEVASALVIERLAACRQGSGLNTRAEALALALREANSSLIEMGQNGPEHRTIGSTAVALIVDAAGFACLWAGDSRAYRVRGGQIVQLTRDHSLVQELVEAGEITAAEAHTHPNANIITRAIGAAPTLQVERVDGDIAPGDVFLIASDGLTRMMVDDELLGALTGADLDTTADGLIKTCLERGAPDNVTLIILRAG